MAAVSLDKVAFEGPFHPSAICDCEQGVRRGPLWWLSPLHLEDEIF